MIKVSVIVPVYNAANYLVECMESLLAQSERELEFIFVNDGSTDDSGNILSEYAAKDHRIVIITQQNHGVSAARNTGLSAANGDYVGFVDADDYVSNDMFSILYESANAFNADIVISDFFAEQGKSKIRISFPFVKDQLLEKQEIRAQILPYFIQKDWMNSACNKIFNRRLIKDNNISFPPGIALGEDAMFNMNAFNSADHVVYADYCGYHYREVEGSATRNIGRKNYFAKVCDTYNVDYHKIMDLTLDQDEIARLKAVRLIDNVMSLIHLYFGSTSMSLKFRFSSVREMVNSKEVRSAVQDHYSQLLEGKSAYARFIIKSIRNRRIFAIYFATLYSKLRN